MATTIQTALKIEPREAKFHQLKGDLYALDGPHGSGYGPTIAGMVRDDGGGVMDYNDWAVRWALGKAEQPIPPSALGANVVWILATNAVLAGALLL